MHLIKQEHHKDLDGIRASMLQIRTALRSAVGGLGALEPLFDLDRDAVRKMTAALDDFEKQMLTYYRMTFDAS